MTTDTWRCGGCGEIVKDNLFIQIPLDTDLSIYNGRNSLVKTQPHCSTGHGYDSLEPLN